MIKLLNYDREKAVRYAHNWAYSRNPSYYNYDLIGGDCTNFISQCIFAGGGIMNYRQTFGWYYINANNKAPAWTGVEFLWNFLTRRDNSVGIIGEECQLQYLIKGDIIQLSFNGYKFQHSQIVVEVNNGNILVATHSYDADNKPLNSYIYKKSRFLHVKGIISI